MRETQIEMAMKQRQDQMSMQMAVGKERFFYYSIFVGLVWLALPMVAIKEKKPQLLAPVVVTGFGWCYQYDMFYGNLFRRAQKEAERLIKEEPERFFLPPGTGIVEQKQYNKIIGIPENYRPRIK